MIEYTPVYGATVYHHLNYGAFLDMLTKLPREAVLYGDNTGNSGYPANLHPELRLSPGFIHDWDVQFNLDYSQTPLTVGDFLDFLLSKDGTPIPHNEDYTVNRDCYVYIGGESPNTGALNGIRMNSDGSFTLSTEHPYA